MSARMRVFGGVTIWRAIAAERRAARLAGSQMNPVCTNLHAVRAFAALRLFDRLDRVEMRAASVRHYAMTLFRIATTRNVCVRAIAHPNVKGEHLRGNA